MKFFKEFWKWLSGKKTIIGLGLLALCGQEFFTNNVPADLVLALEWIGSILSGAGAAHKILKMTAKKKI